MATVSALNFGVTVRNLLATTITKILLQKVVVALLSLSTILIGVSLSAQAYLSQFVIDPTGILTLRAIVLLLVSVLLIFASYFWFKPKLVVSQEDGGCWLDEKTGIRYCVSCKTTHKQLVPLTQESERWRCNVRDCWACYNKKA
jgi:hypothetical protein